VSRGVQSTLGLGVAAVLFGVVIGGILALCSPWRTAGTYDSRRGPGRSRWPSPAS